MPESPRVTVLMSVHNDVKFLPAAVASILEQTLSDFEFLIIEDGSTDGCADWLRQVRDGRVRLIFNKRCLGLTPSLRMGVDEARGQYIARMDADDIALPQRLEKQIQFLEKHRKVGILGTPCILINTEGQVQGTYPVPGENLDILWASLIANPFAHPTVMIRRDILIKNGLNYNLEFQTAQDYDLWTRVLQHTEGANLPEPLVRYRLKSGITAKRRVTQLRTHDIIALRTISTQFPDFDITIEKVGQLRKLFVGGESADDLLLQRPPVAESYLDLLIAFSGHHKGKPGLKALRRRETRKVARTLIRPPLEPGWVRVIGRAFSLHLLLPLFLLSHLASAVSRLLTQSLVVKS